MIKDVKDCHQITLTEQNLGSQNTWRIKLCCLQMETFNDCTCSRERTGNTSYETNVNTWVHTTFPCFIVANDWLPCALRIKMEAGRRITFFKTVSRFITICSCSRQNDTMGMVESYRVLRKRELRKWWWFSMWLNQKYQMWEHSLQKGEHTNISCRFSLLERKHVCRNSPMLLKKWTGK